MSSESDDKVLDPYGPPDVEWKKEALGKLPEGVINCGTNNGRTVYAGRVKFEKELLIGSILSDGKCVFSKDGKVHESTDCGILRVQVGDPLVWKEVIPDNDPPRNCVKSGRLCNGDIIYAGRITNDGNTLIGWVDHDKKVLHVADGDKERTYTSFEILVHQHLDFLCICPPHPCPPPKYH